MNVMAISATACISSPFVDLTFCALLIVVFLFSQLKNNSMGCLTFETAMDNKPS